MRWLASILLVVVTATHYGPDVLGGLYVDHGAATRAWFYVLRGVEAAALYLIVWVLCPFKPLFVRYAVSLVCLWGALESAQTAVCRLALGMDKAPPPPGQYGGLCEVVTGLPIYVFTLLVVLLIATIRYKAGGQKDGRSTSD